MRLIHSTPLKVQYPMYVPRLPVLIFYFQPSIHLINFTHLGGLGLSDLGAWPGCSEFWLCPGADIGRSSNPLRTASGVTAHITSDDTIEAESSEVTRETAEPFRILSMVPPTVSPPGNPTPSSPTSDAKLWFEVLAVRWLLRADEEEVDKEAVYGLRPAK